jgi:hypothetical protein
MTGIVQGLLAAYSAVSSAVSDAYFNLVTLLLPGNGTNGAQNNTFLDSSTNNFSITRNGNATQGTFSPFSQTGWSNYFDQSSRFSLDRAASSFGTNDFTIECWWLANGSQSNYAGIVAQDFNVTNGSWTLKVRSTSDQVEFSYINSTPQNVTASSNVNDGAWHHIAVTRSGTSLRIYIDGTLSTTGTLPSAFSFGSGAGNTDIGYQARDNSFIKGYVSNLRLVNGTALSTGSTYTVSTTPLTAVTNTSLLTCQSNRFIDNSSNAYAITVAAGAPSVQAFSPFAPTAAYSAATVGGSGYFDGTGDYLASATDAALVIGSGEFAIEWWEYRTALGNVDTSIVLGNGTYGALIGYYDSGAVRFLLSTTGSSWNIFNNAPTLSTLAANQWTHFVVTRQSTGAGTSTFRVFVNGKLEIINTSGGSGTVYQPTNQIFVSGGITGSSAPIEGYMSNVRVSIGAIPTDYQTSSTTVSATTVIFTPPTAPVTTTSQGATSGNVEYLLNFTNAGITDATAKNALETVGNAQISTTQSKFGGSSMYFDGNGDNLSSPTSPNLDMGTGNFTVEAWVYVSSRTLNFPLIVGNNNGSYSAGAIALTNSNNDSASYFDKFVLSVFDIATPTLVASSTNSLNTWYHLAIVRNGTTLTMYRDGVSVASTTISSSAVFNWGKSGLRVGGGNWDAAQSYFNGYIDDLRITKGYARYTANFTPPTSAFALQ